MFWIYRLSVQICKRERILRMIQIRPIDNVNEFLRRSFKFTISKRDEWR